MPAIDLSDDELAAVIAALKETLNRDRYHLAPRLEPFRRALAKLDPGSRSATPRAPMPRAGPHARHPAAAMMADGRHLPFCAFHVARTCRGSL